jgi:prepilin-type N-terminal cleavage/methylation domain-containing protein
MSATATSRIRRRPVRRRGLTLVEVLATIVMTGIVLPAAMQGISMCTAATVAARHRSEAAALGEAKLTELIATGDWQYGATGGDFGEDWPDYHWTSASGNWPSDTSLTQLELHVTWTSRQQDYDVVLTTLMYNSQSSSTGTGSTGF